MMGAMNLLADAVAACKEEGTSEEACLTKAKDLFKAMMSADDKAFEAIKEKIIKMAKNIKDGVETRLVYKAEVH